MFRTLAAFFQMTDAVWARHANPWSVWTRVPILPVLTAILWWWPNLGWLAPALLFGALVWTWANPRVFAPVSVNTGWVYAAVYGEKYLVERAKRPIPRHHLVMAHRLSALGIAPMVPYIYGLVTHNAILVLSGLVGILVIKFWFLDRMVWLYRDMIKYEE